MGWIFTSRKIKAAIIGLLSAMATHYVPGLTDDAANQISLVIMGLFSSVILGQAHEDNATKKNGGHNSQPKP